MNMMCPKCGSGNYRELNSKIYDGNDYRWVVRCNDCKTMYTKPVTRVEYVKGHGKPVVQYKDGQAIGRYESVRQASVAVGISPQTLSNCLNGRLKTAGGYEWGYDRRKRKEND